jgi:hypothetical protein
MGAGLLDFSIDRAGIRQRDRKIDRLQFYHLALIAYRMNCFTGHSNSDGAGHFVQCYKSKLVGVHPRHLPTLSRLIIMSESSNATKISDGFYASWMQQSQIQVATLIVIVIIGTIVLKDNLGDIIATWLFFTRRYDFIKSNFEKSGQNAFSFNVLYVCNP